MSPGEIKMQVQAGAMVNSIWFIRLGNRCQKLFYISNLTGPQAEDQFMCSILAFLCLILSAVLIILLSTVIQSFLLKKQSNKYWYWFVGNVIGLGLGWIALISIPHLRNEWLKIIVLTICCSHLLITDLFIRTVLENSKVCPASLTL